MALMRERLIELLRKVDENETITCPRYSNGANLDTCKGCQYDKEDGSCDYAARTADFLLADGWMRPTCKVGDTVYFVFEGDVLSDEITLIEVTESAIYLSTCSSRYMLNNGCLYSEMLDEKAYFTREEAEAALRKEGAK